MEAVLYGTHTTHAPGEFCKRVVSDSYFIAWFETPFLYERDGSLLRGNAGDLLIVPPGMPVYHGCVPDGDTGFINDWIYLHGSELDDMLKACPLPLCTAIPIGNSGILRRYLKSVQQEYAARLPGYQEQFRYLTGQLIVELYRLYLHRGQSSSSHERIARVREEMLGSPEQGWTLAEMAQRSGYSASRFSALYRQQFGCAPKQELLAARIALAAKMLKYTGCTVTEAARATGFQSIYYFSKYFKNTTGVSPSEYARRSVKNHPTVSYP